MLPSAIADPRRYFNAIFGALLAIIIILLAVPAGCILDRRAPVNSIKGSATVDRLDGKTVVEIDRTIDWARFCEAHSSRELIDDKGGFHQLDDSFFGPPEQLGVPSTTRLRLSVPEWLHGRIHYRVRQEYACNPLQRNFPIVIRPADIDFEVP